MSPREPRESSTAKTSDGDYVGTNGMLTFAPGETTKTVTILVYGDCKKEANETFYLDLFSKCGNSFFAEQPPKPPKHTYIETKRGDRMCSEFESVARVGLIGRVQFGSMDFGVSELRLARPLQGQA